MTETTKRPLKKTTKPKANKPKPTPKPTPKPVHVGWANGRPRFETPTNG